MMSVTLVLITLCWVGIGVAAVARRLLADDRQTVDWYQHGLGALGDVTANTGSRSPDDSTPAVIGHVRLLSPAESSLVPTRPRRRQRPVVPSTRRRRRANAARHAHPSRRATGDLPAAHRVVITTRDIVSRGAEAEAAVDTVPVPSPVRALAHRPRRRRPQRWQIGTAAAGLVLVGIVAARTHGHGAAAHAVPVAHERAGRVERGPAVITPTTAPRNTPVLTSINGVPGELAVAVPRTSVDVGAQVTYLHDSVHRVKCLQCSSYLWVMPTILLDAHRLSGVRLAQS